MKLTSFNCTIELSKDENGYSNNYYIDVTDKGVNISHPYITQTPEQVMFATNLIHDFVAQAVAFNDRIDGFNRDNHLEQYTPIELSEEPDTEPEELTEEAKAIAAAKLSAAQELESALAQTSDSPVGTTESESTELVDAGDRLEEVEIKDAPFEETEIEGNKL